MAVVGQGDPRWIVQDRADGANVGNWHWTDKSFTEWFTDQLKSRVCNQTIDGDGLTIATLDMSKCDLEASLRNRKARVNTFVDGSFTLEWETTVDGSSVKGNATLHELDPDFDDSYEIDVRVNSGTGAPADRALAAARKHVRQLIRKQIPQLLADFIEHSGVKAMNAGKLQVAGADSKDARGELSATPATAPPAAPTPTPTPTPAPAPAPAPAPSPAARPAAPARAAAADDTRTAFSYNVKWGVPATVVMEAITDSGRLSALTRSPCTADRKVGGTISLLGGAIRMEITELVDGKTLSLKFRGADWPDGCWSKVALGFETANDSCTMRLAHSEIPEADMERTKSTWRNILWQPMSRLFGYSMQIED